MALLLLRPAGEERRGEGGQRGEEGRGWLALEKKEFRGEEERKKEKRQLTCGPRPPQQVNTLTRTSLCHINPTDRPHPSVSLLDAAQFRISAICYSLAAELVVFCDFWQKRWFWSTLATNVVVLSNLLFHGHVLILPIWTKQLDNLKKGNLEMTISTQEDADALEELPFRDGLRCLCVKPIQDGGLQLGKPTSILWSGRYFRYRVLEIDCTSKLHVSFGHFGAEFVEVLMVHCSRGSSLRVSGVQNLLCLKEVWLKGSYDHELEQDLRQQISSHINEPVLKLEEPCSS